MKLDAMNIQYLTNIGFKQKIIQLKKIANIYISSYFKIIIPGLLITMSLISIFTAIIVLNHNQNSQHRQLVYDRGIMLAKYLSEINKHFIENKQYHYIRCFPVIQEPGVNSCCVVNLNGKIIAPDDQVGKQYNSKSLLKAILKGVIVSEYQNNKCMTIFYPIKKFNQVIGCAILNYNINYFKSYILINKIKLIIVLLILLSFCLITGKFVVNTILIQLKTINEEARIALKKGKNNIILNCSLYEISSLVELLNYMLGKCRHSSTLNQPAINEKKNNIDISKHSVPCCIIDGEQFILKQFNDSFKNLITKDFETGIHVIELFDNSEFSNIIIEMIDSMDIENQIVYQGYRLNIKRASINKTTHEFTFSKEEI